MQTKKEGSGAAFWVIIIFLGIVIAFAAWFFLKREEKPAKANPSQSSNLGPKTSMGGRQTSSQRLEILNCA